MVLEHLHAIGSAVRIPFFVLYTPEEMPGTKVTPDLVAKLIEKLDNFAGMVDATLDWQFTMNVAAAAERARPAFQMVSGTEYMVSAGALGARSMFSSLAGIAPRLVRRLFDLCRKAFPRLNFEIKIVTTKGDKLQTASLANPPDSLPKGLFTRELEVALLKHRADLAVHSLKDLPTELPAGLALGAVTRRADVRDVLIYRDAEYLRAESEKENVAEWAPGHARRRGLKLRSGLADLPSGATVATSSTRRRAQLLAQRADLNVVEIRGNVVTRLQKLADRPEFMEMAPIYEVLDKAMEARKK